MIIHQGKKLKYLRMDLDFSTEGVCKITMPEYIHLEVSGTWGERHQGLCHPVGSVCSGWQVCQAFPSKEGEVLQHFGEDSVCHQACQTRYWHCSFISHHESEGARQWWLAKAVPLDEIHQSYQGTTIDLRIWWYWDFEVVCWQFFHCSSQYEGTYQWRPDPGQRLPHLSFYQTEHEHSQLNWVWVGGCGLDAIHSLYWVVPGCPGLCGEGKHRVPGQQNAILLEKNGKASSCKWTEHINICYFFVTDMVKKGRLSVEWCPTGNMVGDFWMKPSQASLFRKHRDLVMGHKPKWVYEGRRGIIQNLFYFCINWYYRTSEFGGRLWVCHHRSVLELQCLTLSLSKCDVTNVNQ